MGFFLRHACAACITAAVLYSFFFYGRSVGSLLDKSRSQIESAQADLVLVGNSILRAAVNEKSLGKALDCRVLKMSSNGSASAWWYVYTKNVLCAAKTKPKTTIICFRDHFLTDPFFRVDGKYCCRIRALSEADEPVIKELFSRDPQRKASYWGSALTWAPQEARDRWDTRIIKVTADLLRVDKHAQRAALQEVFDPALMDQDLMTEIQLFAEEARDDSVLDFDKMLPNSLLPDLIAVMQEQGIQPIFLRMKRRRDTDPMAQPESVKKYVAQLRDYLEASGAQMIDYTDESLITMEHYGPGDHLNAEGKRLFTKSLAAALQSL